MQKSINPSTVYTHRVHNIAWFPTYSLLKATGIYQAFALINNGVVISWVLKLYMQWIQS